VIAVDGHAGVILALGGLEEFRFDPGHNEGLRLRGFTEVSPSDGRREFGALRPDRPPGGGSGPDRLESAFLGEVGVEALDDQSQDLVIGGVLGQVIGRLGSDHLLPVVDREVDGVASGQHCASSASRYPNTASRSIS
jgi:hypothetical protein